MVPAAEIDGKVEARLRGLAKSTKLTGIRLGKVPRFLLKKPFGRQELSVS